MSHLFATAKPYGWKRSSVTVRFGLYCVLAVPNFVFRESSMFCSWAQGLKSHRPFRTKLSVLGSLLPNFAYKSGGIPLSWHAMDTLGQGKHDEGRARGSKARGERNGVKAIASNPSRPLLFSVALVLGYGLFRGVSANAYLSAFASVEAPFVFVPDLFFNVVVACTVALTALIVITLVLKGCLKPLSMPFIPPILLLLITKLCALFNVFAMLPADMAMLMPGVLFGISSVMLSLVWIEAFASQRPTVIMSQIALGMLVNVVVSSGLSALPGSTQIAVSCVILVLMTLCALYVRRSLKEAAAQGTIDPDAPIAPVLPLPESEAGQSKPLSRRSYRDAFLALGDSLIAYCVLEAVIGLLNSFMLAGSITFAGSGNVSVIASLVGIVVFCVIVFVMQRIPQVSTVFRVLMPILASLLVFLPFLGEVYNLFFSTVLLGSYYFIALLITYVVAEVSRAWRVSPYVLMAAAMGLSRLCLAAALVGGYSIGSMPGSMLGESEHVMRYLVIIVAVIYALSVAAVLVSRDRRRKRKDSALEAAASGRVGSLENSGIFDREVLGEGASVATEVAVVDEDTAFSKRCERIAERCGLTGREGEILGYLARGRTNVYIAGVLYVSENTVRSHVRNIYSKLDVHTRQELIDLVEAEADAEKSADAQ